LDSFQLRAPPVTRALSISATAPVEMLHQRFRRRRDDMQHGVRPDERGTPHRVLGHGRPVIVHNAVSPLQ
jgi:hypothetical protein